MEFKDYMKTIRATYQLTQVELADKLSVSIDTIKKIETGKTSLPSKKMLTALSRLIGKKPVRILQEIMFDESNNTRLLDEQHADHYLNYLAYCYLEGWNINTNMDLTPKEAIPGTEAYDCIAVMAKKKDPNYIGLVESFGKYVDEAKEFHGIAKIKNFMSLYVFKYVAMDIKYREMTILFDYNDELERDLFNQYTRIKFKNMWPSPEIIYLLYDSKKCKVVDTYSIK